MSPRFTEWRQPLPLGETSLNVATIGRTGLRAPVVFLHGFGSTKEDYADFVHHPEFDDRPFLAWDAPGCGATTIDDPARIDLPLLVATAMKMIDSRGFTHFHLVGHSMGGLTGLLLAHLQPERVLSFTSIEGNLAPEDCFLSRQVHEHPAEGDEAFFAAFIERTRQGRDLSSTLYASSLRHKVRTEAVRPIFRSMVTCSDEGALLDKFLGLSCPVHFMYGEQNSHLSYLGKLAQEGARLTSIPHCGHFPMYSNPVLMWWALADFFNESERIQD
ncbi:Proline iminopeptidase [Aeromonas rivipollensis]|uniref:alpha/beta fold hydrolase n=1 Tax=Aeromonas rivipollensis TaxID=948519 RepID=UPI00399CC712